MSDTSGAGEAKIRASAHGYKNSALSVAAEGPSPGPRLTRRDAMQWVLAAVAASAAPPQLFAQPAPPQGTRQHFANQQPDPSFNGKGYGGDPDLLKIYKPGAFWPLTFTTQQRKTATALADVVIPRDKYGPAASEVGVIEMLDEWVSAPYPTQQADRLEIVDGLAWIEGEAQKRFGKPFSNLSEDQHHAICDDICHRHDVKPHFRKAASFFNRFRDRVAGAYYSTPAGWDAIGYVGNVPLPKFEGPPKEVLERLGLI